MNVPFMSRNKVQSINSFSKSHKSSVQANLNPVVPFSPFSSQNDNFKISLQNFPVSPTHHERRNGALVSQ